MAVSVQFEVGRFFLLEYIYDEETLPTNEVGFRKVTNSYFDREVFVNDNDSARITRNVVNDTLIKLNDSSWALIDNDSSFFYPNIDPEIQIEDINFAPELNVVYNTIRIHIISGFNFPNSEGFHLAVGLQDSVGKPIILTSKAFFQSDIAEIIFNPKPIRAATRIYDRYIEVKIPSVERIIESQELSPNGNTIAKIISRTGRVSQSRIINLQFSSIRNVNTDQGWSKVNLDDTESFQLNSQATFGDLTATIQQADDGDYFRYYPSHNTLSIEDFIFSLNSVAGNDYVLIHEIVVSEQIGLASRITDVFTNIQTGDFDTVRKFVPFIENADKAVNFSLDYEVRLFNRANGSSIFRSASITSPDVNKYGKSRARIAVGNTNVNALKIVNQLADNEGQIFDLAFKTNDQQAIFVPTFIERQDVFVFKDDESISEGVSADSVTLTIDRADNFYTFNIFRRSNGQETFIDLSNASYKLKFFTNEGELLVDEFVSITDKINGELSFKIPKSVSEQLLFQPDKSFQCNAISDAGNETVLFKGTFDTSVEIQRVRDQSARIAELTNDVTSRSADNARLRTENQQLLEQLEQLRGRLTEAQSPTVTTKFLTPNLQPDNPARTDVRVINPVTEERVNKNSQDRVRRTKKALIIKSRSKKQKILSSNKISQASATESTRQVLPKTKQSTRVQPNTSPVPQAIRSGSSSIVNAPRDVPNLSQTSPTIIPNNRLPTIFSNRTPRETR